MNGGISVSFLIHIVITFLGLFSWYVNPSVLPRNFWYKKSCLLHPKSAYRQHNKKTPISFFEIGVRTLFDFMAVQSMDGTFDGTYYTTDKRKCQGKQTEISRKIHGTKTEHFWLYSRNLYETLYTITIAYVISCNPYIFHDTIISHSNSYVKSKFCAKKVQFQRKLSANQVQIQIKSGTNSVHKKQKPISYLKSEFLYDSFYGKDRCNIQAHLWRYLLYYNENEMSTKFNRNFSAILPKPFRRKKNISDLIHEIFTISDEQIQSQRKW